MKYAVEMASCGMIYIPWSMKIGTGVQAILKFCLRNFIGCNIGITYKLIGGYTYRHTDSKVIT
jgi:hypothetical protein